MKEVPKVLVGVDPKKEKNAVAEAKYINIPVIAILGSDCDIKDAKYPVVGNDSSKTSIEFLVKELVSAYEEGKKINWRDGFRAVYAIGKYSLEARRGSRG